jgi:NAD(P) transhydrogenase subunit alpha
MIIFAAKETKQDEHRAALTPNTVEKLVQLGARVHIERGFGESVDWDDASWEAAGAELEQDPKDGYAQADIVVSLNPPERSVIDHLKREAILISFLDPFNNAELVSLLAQERLSSLCMELIPRTTYAQKMDALSSQASLAGYVGVLIAAERINKVLPMMTTPAGTIAPARVFVIGVGVAGLQAIATAKRLGARVEAYDTRPVVEEQVRSLGARFVKIDVGETGQTEQGYAKALTEEQLERQRQQMARYCANADIVITTAQVFGRRAPRIVTDDMVSGMRPGSVVIDLAASTGGNVEGTVLDREVLRHGVLIVGHGNFAGEVALDASQMYASNVYNLIAHAWDKETARLPLNPDDDVVGACLLTHEGEIRHPDIREAVEGSS